MTDLAILIVKILVYNFSELLVVIKTAHHLLPSVFASSFPNSLLKAQVFPGDLKKVLPVRAVRSTLLSGVAWNEVVVRISSRALGASHGCLCSSKLVTALVSALPLNAGPFPGTGRCDCIPARDHQGHTAGQVGYYLLQWRRASPQGTTQSLSRGCEQDPLTGLGLELSSWGRV